MEPDIEFGPCAICDDAEAARITSGLVNEFGYGYKKTHRRLKDGGFSFGRDLVQRHVAHMDRTVLTAIGEAADRGVEVPSDYFERHGIELPPEGTEWKAATVTMTNEAGEKSWVRIAPAQDDETTSRVEIRQATPITIDPKPVFTFHMVSGNWVNYVVSPDAQIGYWVDSDEVWHTTHDESAFSLGHQVAWSVAQDDGLQGWADVGDFLDLAAPSRHNPTSIDLRVDSLNRALQRGYEEMARRRALVGDGELILTGGNHDLRVSKATTQNMPYLVGLRRAGDPEEMPVLSLPFLLRLDELDVDFAQSFPYGYRRLNSNLFICHSPAYGSKALETARKISQKIHASVIFGHTHRREALAENIETDKGVRTLEVWSDGTWARTDGSLPSGNNVYDEKGNRLLVPKDVGKWGQLSENMHQGVSVVHLETSGRERFSVERVAFWNGFAQWRGVSLYANCDADGNIPVLSVAS